MDAAGISEGGQITHISTLSALLTLWVVCWEHSNKSKHFSLSCPTTRLILDAQRKTPQLCQCLVWHKECTVYWAHDA